MMLSLLSGPLEISAYGVVCHYLCKRVELPAKYFLRKFFMNKGMASPADINPPLFHVSFFKVLFEPLVTMTGSRNKMMKRYRSFTTTERTSFHYRITKLLPYNKIILT
jgi:hypothetical protein